MRCNAIEKRYPYSSETICGNQETKGKVDEKNPKMLQNCPSL